MFASVQARSATLRFYAIRRTSRGVPVRVREFRGRGGDGGWLTASRSIAADDDYS